MWAVLLGLLGRVFSFFRWMVRRDAAQDAQQEMGAEIAAADRKRANEIRDRIDSARLGGGLQSKPEDTRGYRD